jgi:hypothetical protein
MADETKKLPLQAEVEKVLSDLRGVIDEALLQINLGEKNVKELISPVVERVSNGIAEIKSRL